MQTIPFQYVPEYVFICLPEFIAFYAPELYEEELETGILAHQMFGGLVRFTGTVCDRIVKTDTPDLEAVALLRRIADMIEHIAQFGDHDTLNLVQVSFMENLHQLGAPEHYELLKRQLGVESQQLLKDTETSWWSIALQKQISTISWLPNFLKK